MRRSTRVVVPAFVATMLAGPLCIGQDVELPLTWEGKGTGTFITEGGTNEVDLQLELSVDEQGMVSGEASTEDGAASIKHVFYTDGKSHDAIPGFFTRKIVIVLLLNESEANPPVAMLNGRVPADRFLYGEVLLTQYEAGSDMARALGIGNPEPTWMQEDQMPMSLRSALKECLPIGVAYFEGDYRKQEAAAAAQPPDTATISLFNGEDLQDWYIYVPEADVDPLSVWKVQDGTIGCTGKPTSLLRTKKEYSDYRLTFEWRWPEKPGNSGVLLHAGAEDKIWPQCLEAQLMHNRAGDFVGMGCTFNENKNTKEGAFIHYTPRMNKSNEKEPGEWNSYEIVCKGDTIEASINGQLQNRATGVSLTKGYIGFQSEGVPIVFRDIKLTFPGNGLRDD